MIIVKMKEKLYEYELVQYEGHSFPRKYSLYRLTESEAHAKNQAYALNHIPKRFVKVENKTEKITTTPLYTMKKKLCEYELVILDEDSDEETIAPRKYYFRDETAQEHNEQYALSDVPRKLVKVKEGKVIEKPEWWSGTQEHLREIAKKSQI